MKDAKSRSLCIILSRSVGPQSVSCHFFCTVVAPYSPLPPFPVSVCVCVCVPGLVHCQDVACFPVCLSFLDGTTARKSLKMGTQTSMSHEEFLNKFWNVFDKGSNPYSATHRLFYLKQCKRSVED